MVGEQDGTADIEPADHGFRKGQRLQTTSDFSLVFADRRSLRGEVFVLHYRTRVPTASAELVGARLGIVVPKKLAHRAVQRNLLKRLGREAFRVARQKLPPYDLVLRLAKPPGSVLDSAARKVWRADIERLLVRLPR